MADIIRSDRIATALPVDDYFTPEARNLCARVKHKSELTDDETLMLALAGCASRAGALLAPRCPISRRNTGGNWHHPRS
jgi:hypothetical protein